MNRLAALTFVLVCLAAAARVPADDSVTEDSKAARVKQQISEATALWAQRDFTRAIAVLDQALQAEGDDSALLESRAAARYSLGDHAGSVDDLTRAIAVTPQDSSLYRKRGGMRLDRGLAAEAMIDLSRAIELDPNDAYAHLSRSAAQAAHGDLREALADVTVFIRIRPQERIGYTTRAEYYLIRDSHEMAVADLKRALDCGFDRDDAKANCLARLAVAQAGCRRFSDAQQSAEAAFKLHPKSGAVRHALGLVKAAAGDHAAAIDEFTIAISLEPRRPGYLYDRARSYLATDDAAKALKDVDQLIDGLAYQGSQAFDLRAAVRAAMDDQAGSNADIARGITAANAIPSNARP